MGKQRSLLFDASWYIFASYSSQILIFCSGLYTKKILGPEQLGIWTQIFSIFSLLGLIDLGVIQASNKTISYVAAKGDQQTAGQVMQAACQFAIISAIIGSAAAIFLAETQTTEPGIKGLLIASLLLLPANQLALCLISHCWALRKFEFTGLLAILEGVLSFAVGIALVQRFGIKGQLGSLFLSTILKLSLLLWYISRQNISLQLIRPNTQLLIELLKTGIPLSAVGMATTLRLYGLNVIVGMLFDSRALGLFALALSVQNMVFWVPNAVSIVMFPRIQAIYAKTENNANHLLNLLVKPFSVLSTSVLPVTLSGIYFLVEPTVNRFLPNFAESVPLIRAMLPAIYFVSLENLPAQFLITTDKLFIRVCNSLIGVITILITSWIGFLKHLSLTELTSIFSWLGGINLIVSLYAMVSVAPRGSRARQLPMQVIAISGYLFIILNFIKNTSEIKTGTALEQYTDAVVDWMKCLLLLSPLILINVTEAFKAKTIFEKNGRND